MGSRDTTLGVFISALPLFAPYSYLCKMYSLASASHEAEPHGSSLVPAVKKQIVVELMNTKCVRQHLSQGH